MSLLFQLAFLLYAEGVEEAGGGRRDGMVEKGDYAFAVGWVDIDDGMH